MSAQSSSLVIASENDSLSILQRIRELLEIHKINQPLALQLSAINLKDESLIAAVSKLMLDESFIRHYNKLLAVCSRADNIFSINRCF